MKLHPTTVVFDEVSGVVVAKGSTFFNFSSNGVHQYSVQILGKPVLHAGMKVTALLEEPGNWQTIKGWVDHASGEIVGVTPPRAALRGLYVFVIVFLIFLALAIEVEVRGINDHHLFPYLSVVTGLCTAGLFVHWRQAEEITETLKSSLGTA